MSARSHIVFIVIGSFCQLCGCPRSSVCARSHPRAMRSAFRRGSPFGERSYALGGGGSGDLVTDRSSFAKRNGLSLGKDNEGPTGLAATPTAFGAHEIITEQPPGARGTEQSSGREFPSRSCSSAECAGIPGMSRIPEANARAEIVESHAWPPRVTDTIRSTA